MRYYVYALIDPTKQNTPFYIGKGTDRRLQHHFKEAQAVREGTVVVGCSPDSLVEDAQKQTQANVQLGKKAQRIKELLDQRFQPGDLGRTMVRHLDEDSAKAVEAFLIRHVYGIDQLTNRVEGEHAWRFRHKGDWTWSEVWDGQALSGQTWAETPHYVYVLRDPTSGRVFYVGKGTGNRMAQHFRDARATGTRAKDSRKLAELKCLLESGLKEEDIGRVIAKVEREDLAFLLEAITMKLVYGLSQLANEVASQHAGLVRAKDDWEPRKGFDQPFIFDPKAKSNRSELLDMMVGEGLDQPLIKVRENFPYLQFDPFKVLDSKDLGLEATVPRADGTAGARVKIFIRSKKLQAEIRTRRVEQEGWIRAHFAKLNASQLLRGDLVFLPDEWKRAGMTTHPEILTERVGLLVEILRANQLEDLSMKAAELLRKPKNSADEE